MDKFRRSPMKSSSLPGFTARKPKKIIILFLKLSVLRQSQISGLITFMNGGVFCYSFVVMLIRPTGLTLV